MAEQPIINIQHGIWLDANWLKKAGLGSHLQVIVQPGEIRIRPASNESDLTEDLEEGWDAFLSLEAGTQPGKFQDASTNHDQYLYTMDS